MYPLVSELAADGIPVVVACRVLKLARQPYYRWLAHPIGSRELDEAYLASAIFDAHADDPEFGYRLLADEAREAGLSGCDRTVWRICAANRWWSVFGKPRGRNGKRPGPPAHDDLVKRDFTAQGPNQLWLTDITEHWTGQGKVYLCAIKDEWSNRIVGYSISDRMKSRIAVDALNMAVARRGQVAGCIVHSDRGSQGGFNWWSQHLDRGGVGWGSGIGSGMFVSIGVSFPRRGDRRLPGVRIGSGSGRRSLAG
ncbi:Putative transposase InsK for insertion sequence element IS150 [Propionicimonas sp. T2.31MG-18]